MFLSQSCVFGGRIRTHSQRSSATTNGCAWSDGFSLRGQIRGALWHRRPHSRQWGKRFAGRSPRTIAPPMMGLRFASPGSQALMLGAAGSFGPGFLCSLLHQLVSADSSRLQISIP
jgi:hypothetical protein